MATQSTEPTNEGSVTSRSTSRTSQPASESAPAESKPEPVVKYTGLATRRILSQQDWENVGAKGQEAVEWNFSNNFQVPVSKFSQEALAYLKIDNRFVIAE